MKNIIRKILKEEFHSDSDSDWDWMEDIDPDERLKNFDYIEAGAEVFLGNVVEYDEEGEEYVVEINEEQIEEKSLILEYYLAKFHFSDTEFRDGKIYLTVGYWSDFVQLFEDCGGGYNYICRYLASNVLSENYDWEPYYDIVGDWYDEVWGLINNENVGTVINFINNNFLGEVIEYEGDNLEITEELLNTLSTDSDTLGKIIDESPEFSDIKQELEFSYEGAYNSCVYDNVWSSAHEAITDLFGEGEWEYYQGVRNGEPVTKSKLIFNITDIFWEIIEAHFTNYCDLGYDRACDFEHFGFLDNVSFFMGENIWGEELNPRYDEYPNHNDMLRAFNEEVSDRLYSHP